MNEVNKRSDNRTSPALRAGAWGWVVASRERAQDLAMEWPWGGCMASSEAISLTPPPWIGHSLKSIGLPCRPSLARSAAKHRVSGSQREARALNGRGRHTQTLDLNCAC